MLFIEQENNLSCIIGLSYNFISKTSMSDKNINNSPFNTLKNIVEKDLSHVNELLFSMAKSHDAQLVDKISSHILSAGGKRIRPILCLVFARLFNQECMDQIYLAAAIECIHTATLLHDDVIDESETRRGLKTANNIWGDKASILVGDFLFSQAFKLMVNTGSIKALEILATASAIISESEVMQLDQIGNIDMDLDSYNKLINSKTAELFAAASSTGAMSAGANEDLVSDSRDYGRALGMCFQIVDDVLDYTGKQESFGKEIGNDFFEGKVTAPLIFAIKNASIEDKEKIKSLFVNRHQNGAFEKVKELIIKNKGVEDSLRFAQEYADSGLKILENFPNNQIRNGLKGLFLQIILRNN